jgi:mannose-6-phosphate isomerase-like protein (cupin superfamily)
MAQFSLPPGYTFTAVRHRIVEEIWYFVSGHGQMWCRQGEHEEVVAAEPGVSITIPLGTEFQFRTLGDQALTAVAITMPPWPGDDEALVVEGHWKR